MSRKSHTDGGFTLVELLVVMIIIGILAAIAIPVFLNQRKASHDAALRADLHVLATYMETVNVDAQSYPDAVTVAGTTASLAIGAVVHETVTVSAGNDFAVAAGQAPGTFCLEAWNPNATATAAVKVVFDSDQGGLQPIGTACS